MTLNFIFRMVCSAAVMIVCHCHAVTDRAIRRVVREGACSLREVALASRAGRMCGGCRPAVKKLIEEETAALATASTAAPAGVAAS
jgi:bacterioferritin-associated ferredoxin